MRTRVAEKALAATIDDAEYAPTVRRCTSRTGVRALCTLLFWDVNDTEDVNVVLSADAWLRAREQDHWFRMELM